MTFTMVVQGNPIIFAARDQINALWFIMRQADECNSIVTLHRGDATLIHDSLVPIAAADSKGNLHFPGKLRAV